MSSLSRISIRPGIFLSKQFALFLIVGVIAATAHWLYRYGLNFFMSYTAALVLAYALSLGTAFLMMRRYVFPASRKPVRHQASYFLIVQTAMFPLVFGVAYGLSELVLVHYLDIDLARNLAHAIAVPLPALLSFVLQKFIAFDA